MTAAVENQLRPPTTKTHAQIRLVCSLVLFAVGCFAWMFKMKRSSALDDYLLPYSPLQVLYPALGGLALFWILRTSGARFPKIMVRSPSTLLLLLGTLSIMLGAAVHIHPGQYLKDALLYEVRWLLPFCFLAFLFLARKFGTPYRPIVWGLCAGAGASAVATELFRHGLPLPICASGQRYGGFLSHPNQYGILISSTAPMLAILVFSRSRLRLLIGLAMIGVYGLCLFQSLSKTNIVLVVISGLGAAFLVSLPNLALAARRLFLTLAMLVVLAVAGFFGVQVLEEISPREAKTIENAVLDPGGTKSLDDRENVCDEAVAAIRRFPLTGVGPGRSEFYLTYTHAHNLFLQHWIDAGLAGFIGICLVTVAVFWRAFELLGRALRARGPLSEDASIRVLAGLALVMSICANSMSASLTTAVMTAFVVFIGIAFVRESDPALP